MVYVASVMVRDLVQAVKFKLGEAVGIIAAQSIGEPGYSVDNAYIPYRWIVAGDDITQGFTTCRRIIRSA